MTAYPPEPPAARPRRHLLTAEEIAAGRSSRVAARRRGMTLNSVQKWVMSTLAVSTILHLAAGLVLAAAYVEALSSKIGLLVLSGAFGLVAWAAGLLIHGRSIVHPLMLLGLLPPVLGAWWVLG